MHLGVTLRALRDTLSLVAKPIAEFDPFVIYPTSKMLKSARTVITVIVIESDTVQGSRLVPCAKLFDRQQVGVSFRR